MPVFSVIIPLYNKAPYVAKTLESVFSQDFVDFEVIVVDDGATDSSAKIVKQCNDPRLQYFYKENGGVSSARNVGISMAKGALIAFIDADDYWAPGHLSALYRLHLEFPRAGLLAARYELKFSEKRIVKPHFKNLPENFRGIVPDFFEANLTYRVATASSVAVTAAALKTIGYFNTALSNGEDNDMWTRIALEYDVALNDTYTALYNFHIAGTLSKRKMGKRALSDFSQFSTAEKTNISLKKFLDMYRLQYALNLKAEGSDLWKRYHAATAAENISFAKKILLLLPPFALRFLKKLKKAKDA
jgi:glycosyltransferase involved in cell wall biosynthesis